MANACFISLLLRRVTFPSHQEQICSSHGETSFVQGSPLSFSFSFLFV